MAPTRELRDIIRRTMDVPRVVGAGIGARPRSAPAEGPCEPILTVLVEECVPGDEDRICVALGKGYQRPVDVMKVGRVSALPCDRPKA